MLFPAVLVLTAWAICVVQATVTGQFCTTHVNGRLSINTEDTCPRMTGLNPSSNNGPWSHEQYCLDDTVDPDSGNQSFCVFTMATSSSGRGFSIVTIPAVAQTVKSHLSPSPDSQSVAQPLRNSNESISYEARLIPSQGMGLFTTDNITAGQVILTDHPAFVISRDALSTLSRSERQYLQWRGIMQLPLEVRNLVRSLAKSRGGDEIDDVLQTNGISLSYGSGISHLAVLPQAARTYYRGLITLAVPSPFPLRLHSTSSHINSTSAYYRFDEDTHSLEVFALRGISTGEQITFSYGFPELPQQKRHHLLKLNWSFKCTCPLCTSPPATISASDKRLGHLAELKESLSKASGSLTPERILELVEEILRVFDEEGLITSKARYAEIAAYAASQLGDEAKARECGEVAREHWGIVAGEGSWEVKRVEELLRDVKGHGSWGGGKPEKSDQVGYKDR